MRGSGAQGQTLLCREHTTTTCALPVGAWVGGKTDRQTDRRGWMPACLMGGHVNNADYEWQHTCKPLIFTELH